MIFFYYSDASCHYKSIVPITIEIADGGPLVATKTVPLFVPIYHIIFCTLPFLCFTLSQLSMNWPSISQLNVARYHVTFTDTHYPIQDLHTGKQMGTGHRLKGLYHLEQLHLLRFIQLAAPTFSLTLEVSLLHSRFRALFFCGFET